MCGRSRVPRKQLPIRHKSRPPTSLCRNWYMSTHLYTHTNPQYGLLNSQTATAPCEEDPLFLFAHFAAAILCGLVFSSVSLRDRCRPSISNFFVRLEGGPSFVRRATMLFSLGGRLIGQGRWDDFLKFGTATRASRVCPAREETPWEIFECWGYCRALSVR